MQPTSGGVIHWSGTCKAARYMNRRQRRRSAFVQLIDAIERFIGLKQKKTINNKLLLYLMIFILILTAASAMYSYYYGLNVNCALHTRACP